MTVTVECKNRQQAQAIAAVVAERNYQDDKWGTVTDRPREVGTYLTLVRAHMVEADAGCAVNNHDEVALEEVRKVVALGMACLEQYGSPVRK